jgi:RNA polymerase sigma-70 factor (ECF subfamily)
VTEVVDRGALDDDEQLLAGLRAADGTAYERLIRLHGGRLLAVARRILGNEEDARDAVQEAFVSAFKHIGGFEGGSRLSTWLHRIVVNVALMRLRTRRRKPEVGIDDLLPAFQADGHHVEQFQQWADSAHDLLERAEVRTAVRAAIDQLPDTYRVVLLLRDIEDRDTADVAAILGITPNACKIRLHRARQALRTLLAPHFLRDRS